MAKREKSDMSRLADLTNLDDKASKVSERKKSKTFGRHDIQTPTDPPTPGLTAKNRAKFTTMLSPDLREKLDNVAKRNKMSIADVLEIIVKEYFDLK